MSEIGTFRIYYPKPKSDGSRNYFECFSFIGPKFGADKSAAWQGSKEEGLHILGQFSSYFCSGELEEIKR